MDGEIYPSAKHIHASSQRGRHKKRAGESKAHFSEPEREREREKRKSKRAVICFHLKY